MDDERILARLGELGLELPAVTPPVAAYVPCVVHGATATVAGQLPFVEGALLNPGTVGEHVSVDEGAAAAGRAALLGLAALRSGLGGSFARLERIVQVTVFVATVPGFVDHPKVANGASELLGGVLGDPGAHARVSVGVTSLPLGASVEVAITAAVTPA
ncbi:MAG TPA: RidA family protein [Actinomycetota bacterium]|nr:RidA family protein [Actinomycetota bacterium]